MKHLVKILSLGAALAAAPLAYATPITGSIGFAGNGSYSASANYFTAGPNIGTSNQNAYVFGPAASGGPTGSMNVYTNFNPAEFYNFSTATIGSGELVFSTTQNGKVLTFTLTSFTNDTSGTGGDSFAGMGVLTETGYDATNASFTLANNAGSGTFVTFNTAVAATPEPSSLVLLGSGLVSAAGMLLRRRRIA